MQFIHNSQDTKYRSAFGAQPVSTEVTLMLLAQGADSVKLRTWSETFGEQILDTSQSGAEFSVCLKLPKSPCALFYYFIIQMQDGQTLYYGNNIKCMGGIGQTYHDNPVSFQITVYEDTPVPKWYKDGLVYQIFPDRFARSGSFDPNHFGTLPDYRGGVERVVETDWYAKPVNEFNEHNEIKRWKFYGGSLDGIREKLDYLKELGVTVIYLNPIFRARSTHRYDTADYMMIDPGLGDETSFKRLADEAKAAGIRLILDGVFNHCGADSKYFDNFNQFYHEEGIEGARHFVSSKYHDWFTFYPGSNPEFRCWWNITDMPDFRTDNPEYIEYICGKDGVLDKWLKLGASGWRLDVADELPNDFLKAIRKTIKEHDPDNLLMGEVWDDPTNKYNYGHLMEYFWGEELDCTMNYPFRAAVLPFVTGVIPAGEFVQRYMNLAENYPPENLYGSLNLLGSHDRERVMNILGGYPMARYGFDHDTKYNDLTEDQYTLARLRYKMLSILQFALPGVPDIYYGDEAGLMGGSDPDCRRAYPWGREDEDLLAHFKWLGTYYHEHPCLKDGRFELSAINEDVLALERYNENEHLLILINRSEFSKDVIYKGECFYLMPYEAKIL